VEIGGFDTHSDVEEILVNRFSEINSAVEAFVKKPSDSGKMLQPSRYPILQGHWYRIVVMVLTMHGVETISCLEAM
jgi:hypothetical protein